MAEREGFRVTLVGNKEAVKKLNSKIAKVRKGMRRGARDTRIAIAGKVKESFGRTGRPRRGTGRLSRAIRSYDEARADAIYAVVGVHASVPYGRILELGGDIPAHDVFPVRKKALAWTTGLTRLGQLSALGFGVTRRQAFRLGTSRKGKFRRGKFIDPGDVRFAKRVHIPARSQRAIPFLRPGFEEDRPNISGRFERRVLEALKG